MSYQLKNLACLFLVFVLVGCGGDPSSSETNKSESVAATEMTQNDEPSDNSSGKPDGEVANDAKDTDAAIDEIRNNYQKIREAIDRGKLRKDSIGYDCESDPGGGELIRYYNDNDLVLIKHAEGGEHHYHGKEIYLQKGEPFFVLEEEGSWSFGGPGDGDNPTTIDKIEERRYYIQDGQLIRQLLKQYENKSWEKEKTSDQVPNQTVELGPGATYPGAGSIPKFILGDVGC